MRKNASVDESFCHDTVSGELTAGLSCSPLLYLTPFSSARQEDAT